MYSIPSYLQSAGSLICWNMLRYMYILSSGCRDLDTDWSFKRLSLSFYRAQVMNHMLVTKKYKICTCTTGLRLVFVQGTTVPVFALARTCCVTFCAVARSTTNTRLPSSRLIVSIALPSRRCFNCPYRPCCSLEKSRTPHLCSQTDGLVVSSNSRYRPLIFPILCGRPNEAPSISSWPS